MTPHNLLFPIRQLTKRPGIAVAIVLVMAAGIGVNAAVFSVVYAVLLKALPYPDPQQLVFIPGTSGTGERIPISFPDFRDWRTHKALLQILPGTMCKTSICSLTGKPSIMQVHLSPLTIFVPLEWLPSSGACF